MQDTFQWTDETVLEFIQFSKNRERHWTEFIPDIEQFKASKAPKKEWEIVAFKSITCRIEFIYNKCKDGQFRQAGSTSGEGCTEESMKEGGATIHSVRRLSDGEVFVKNELVGTPSDGQHHIGGFEVRGNFLYVQFSIGQITIEHLQKLPQPILTTSDGVDIFEDREVTVVYLKDHSYSIGPLSGYHPQILDDNKVFADDYKAQQYILDHALKLSLNDVKEALNKCLMFDPCEDVENYLTTLVKQKLNQ